MMVRVESATSARLQRLAIRAVKHASMTFDRLVPPTRGIVILLYHRVGRRSTVRVDLPLWLFEEQISRISSEPGVFDMDSALQALAAGPALPSPVAVTFDDGTADFVDVAFPVLARYKVSVTLYIATSFIEEGRMFPDDGRPATWAGLRDAMSTGLLTIGSHTHNHLLLDRADPAQVASDIARSKGLIEDRLQTEAKHFAYPKALLAEPNIEVVVRESFRSAALAGTRPNPVGCSDPYRLSRTPVQIDDGLRYFQRKLAGGMRLEDDLRTLLNRRRLAGALH